jgi:hypothetical protein
MRTLTTSFINCTSQERNYTDSLSGTMHWSSGGDQFCLTSVVRSVVSTQVWITHNTISSITHCSEIVTLMLQSVTCLYSLPATVTWLLLNINSKLCCQVPYFLAYKMQFFPEKCDLNSTRVLFTEGKYYVQTYNTRTSIIQRLYHYMILVAVTMIFWVFVMNKYTMVGNFVT